MSENNPWKIEYREGEWHTITGGKSSEGQGFYEISFEGKRYGFVSKEAWDKQTTGEILTFVEKMLNDAHELALKENSKIDDDYQLQC